MAEAAMLSPKLSSVPEQRSVNLVKGLDCTEAGNFSEAFGVANPPLPLP
jgi:hypothetical protein